MSLINSDANQRCEPARSAAAQHHCWVIVPVTWVPLCTSPRPARGQSPKARPSRQRAKHSCRKGGSAHSTSRRRQAEARHPRQQDVSLCWLYRCGGARATAPRHEGEVCPDPQADTKGLSLWLWVCVLFFACAGSGGPAAVGVGLVGLGVDVPGPSVRFQHGSAVSSSGHAWLCPGLVCSRARGQ